MLALPGATQAQGRDVYKLPMPMQMAGASMGRAQPGVAASSPIGFGPSRGDIFAGLGYQTKTGTSGEQDGALSVGGGFFNPNETVGLEVVLTSLSTIRSGFGSRMVAGAKVHKIVNDFGIGLGIEGLKLNGDEFDTDPSIYVAATTVRPVRDAETFNQATFNLGLGNGRFQSAEDFSSGETGIGVFASAALRMNYFSTAIVDYTGAQVNLALSFSPLQNVPLVITPALNDVTGASGSAARLSLGVGMSWKY
jgi:hypothetical protein